MPKKSEKQNRSQNKKKYNKKKLVLLDAHAIIHRAYHALPDFSTSSGEPTGGLYGVAAMLIKIINELKPDYIAACYDLPEPTFRHEAYDEYKAGRAKADDDLVLQINRSRDIFKAFNIPIYEQPGFEADDILGTIVYQMKGKNIDIVIASGDMDTLQLVEGKKVRVYTLRKGISDTVIYDEKAVVDRFGFKPALLVDFKGLRGDPSDNIIGIAGIGEKTATALIQKFGSIEKTYKALKKDESLFEKAGIKPRVIKLLKEGEEEAEFSKTLATIRHDAPITFSFPEKSWSEGFDIAKVEKLFVELEFRTLLARARQIFGSEEDRLSADTDQRRTEEEEINEKDIKEAEIALWLLHSDITNPTPEDIMQYAKTNSFYEAKKKLLREIKKTGLERVYCDIELPIIRIVEQMQKRGILIDKRHFKELSKKYHKELDKIEKNIWRLSGERFNINSPKQLGEILFDKMNLSAKGLKKTAGGARSTRESELVKLKGEHDIVEKVLAYRELQKILSTYIDNIPDMADDRGRLHATLNQAGTTTGRFSSTNPNMQNIPIKGDIGTAVRNGFVAERGYTLVALDYSQIEMRVLAALSKSKMLIDVFKTGGDVHASVASYVFGVDESKVTKDMRRKAKVINFGIIYGMGINALRVNLGGTRAEAQEFYNNYFKKFPRVAKYFDTVKKDAARNGFTETLFGRRRYFEGIHSTIAFIRAAAERQAINAPLQGTAADIIKIAMKKTDEAIVKAGLQDDARLLLQVHDELIYEIKDEYVEKASKLIKETMEHAVDFPVPLTVDVSVGKRWGEMG